MPGDKFRQQAEEKIDTSDIKELIEQDIDFNDLVHELKVHQVELELQNNELRKTQNELLLAKEKYHDLFSKAPIAYFIFNQEGVIKEVNNRGAELLNKQRTNLLNKPLLLYLTQKAQEKFYLHRQRVLAKGNRDSCELVMKRKNGEEFHAYLESVAISQLSSDQEQVLRTVILDITEQKERKKELNILYRAIEQSPAIIVITDPQGKIEYVNPKYSRVTGYSLSELEGKQTSFLKSGLHSEEFYQRLWTQIKSGNKWEGIFKNKKKNGEIFKEESVVVPISNQSGEISQYLKVSDDVTKELKLEEELKFRIELEKLLNDFALNFINIEVENIDRGIEEALEEISVFSDIKQSYIYLLSQEDIIEREYTWCANDYKQGLKEFNRVKPADYKWVMNDLKENKVIFKNSSEVPKLERNYLQRQNLKSIVLLPMFKQDDLIGILGFNFAKEKAEISKNLLTIFEIIAEIFANALARKEMENKLNNYTNQLESTNRALEKTYNQLNQKIEKAKELHKLFFPNKFPEIDKLSFGAYYQPADNLGGDFYNLIETENSLIFYLVDVIGHGLDGAMLNVFVRESINSFLLNRNNTSQTIVASEIIEFIHQRYCEEAFPNDYFICLSLGVLNLENMELNISNAGFQIPPLINQQQLKKIDVKGLPISSAVAAKYFKTEKIMNITFKLEAGDTIFLTTDGLIEEETDGEIYGLARLEANLEKNYYLQPKEMIEEIKVNFKEFNGSLETADDITMLAIKLQAELLEELEERIKNEFQAIEQLKNKIKFLLSSYVDDVDPLMMGIHEMFINAFEHGNKGDTEKNIICKIKIFSDHLKIQIADEGEGFEIKDEIGEVLADPFAERGRGLAMTNLIYDQLFYNDLGNEVTLIKSI